MAQILDPIPQNLKSNLLCCYVNATSHIQVVRITNIPNWYFERVVFPGQRLVFEALSEALLEIHTGMMASSILSDTIPCERLCISDSGDLDLDLDLAPDEEPISSSPIIEHQPLRTVIDNEQKVSYGATSFKSVLVSC
jgi:hypothetical protein